MAVITVSTTGIPVVPRDPKRSSIAFKHGGTANTIYLSRVRPTAMKAAVAELELTAGQPVSVNIKDDGEEAVISEWSAIADSGSNRLVVFSGKKSVRDIQKEE